MTIIPINTTAIIREALTNAQEAEMHMSETLRRQGNVSNADAEVLEHLRDATRSLRSALKGCKS